MTSPSAASKTLEPRELEVARWLLRIGAVNLSPRIPYTWASGVRSPVYCDCRRIMSFPEARRAVAEAWSGLLKMRWPDAKALVGVATGGIAHAAFISDRMELPMGYVRSAAKDHGLGKRVEGVLEKGTPIVVIEDLVSTGGSLLEAAQACATEGLQVVGASSVFTYELPQSRAAFEKAGIPLAALTCLRAIQEVAGSSGALSADDLALVDQGMASVEEQLRSRRP